MENEWISINDNLPEAGQKVLLWLVRTDESEGHMMSWSWEKQDSSRIKINGEYITHWFPIPQPPKS